MSKLSNLFRHYFNLDADKDDESEIIAGITKNIHFRGANLWTLVFAIIIASVGLNVNSTAVIIGAMLISPLMGPIMGVGLGIGISDFDLVRRGLKNLLIAVVFSIATSALYFYLTPLHNATSELLARTTPTIWDVFIAFAGGLAGIVGVTRKEKGNVIPGVAISTALMPPLCTVGYGIATGHWYYSLGALYLFFINSVFICTATVLIIRFMHFHKRVFQNDAHKKRLTRYMLIVVVLTIAPSVWLAYGIVRKAVFENSAQRFVSKEFDLPNTQVINSKFIFDAKAPKIELLLIGTVLDSSRIDTLKQHLEAYDLSGTSLIIRQGLNAQKQLDLAQIKASILDEAFNRADTNRVIIAQPALPPEKPALPDLKRELAALFPQVTAFSLDRIRVVHTSDTLFRKDSVVMFIADSRKNLAAADQKKLLAWLKAKLGNDSLQVIYRVTK